MPKGVNIAPVVALTDDDQRRLRSLFETAFPPDERDEPDEFLEGILSGETSCIAAHLDGALVGFATYRVLHTVAVTFLEYMAVDKPHRGFGIGSDLLVALIAHLRSRFASMHGVVFEVEPIALADGEERSMRERRVAFYQRNGAVVLNGAPRYLVPNLSGPGVVSFTLMWIPLEAGWELLDAAHLRAVVTAMLVEGYGLASDHPLVELNENAIR